MKRTEIANHSLRVGLYRHAAQRRGGKITHHPVETPQHLLAGRISKVVDRGYTEEFQLDISRSNRLLGDFAGKLVGDFRPSGLAAPRLDCKNGALVGSEPTGNPYRHNRDGKPLFHPFFPSL